MPTLKFKCENCDSVFAVNYRIEECESDPAFCSFCAEPLFYEDNAEQEEEEFDDE